MKLNTKLGELELTPQEFQELIKDKEDDLIYKSVDSIIKEVRDRKIIKKRKISKTRSQVNWKQRRIDILTLMQKHPNWSMARIMRKAKVPQGTITNLRKRLQGSPIYNKYMKYPNTIKQAKRETTFTRQEPKTKKRQGDYTKNAERLRWVANEAKKIATYEQIPFEQARVRAHQKWKAKQKLPTPELQIYPLDDTYNNMRRFYQILSQKYQRKDGIIPMHEFTWLKLMKGHQWNEETENELMTSILQLQKEIHTKIGISRKSNAQRSTRTKENSKRNGQSSTSTIRRLLQNRKRTRQTTKQNRRPRQQEKRHNKRTPTKNIKNKRPSTRNKRQNTSK